MTIKEIPINGFKDKLENSKLNYPQSQNSNAPRLFFNLLSVASRGGSKTYTTVKMIKDFENNKLISPDGTLHPLRSILISPTFEANPIFKNLKSLSESDIYHEYNDNIFQSIIDDIKNVKQEIEDYKEYKNAYEILDKTPKSKIIDLYKKNREIFEILEMYNFEHYDNIPQPRFNEIPVNFIILDDLMGSSCFNKKAQSLLTYYLIKNRHLFISFFILVQSLKSVPKPVRSNCNVFFLGKFCSQKVILDDLYEEVSNTLTEEQFEEIYNYATKDKYGALIIDTSGDTKKFYKALDKELIFE